MSMHTEIKVFIFISYQVFLLGLSFLPILLTEQFLNSLFGAQNDVLSSSLCRTELFIGSQMVTILIILIMSPPPTESITLLGKVFISWCLTTLLFHLIFWCYGAPAFESFTCTLHLSSLMASLTVIPYGMVIDANSKRFQKIFLLNKTETSMECTVWYSTWGAAVGAWLGAFPIPLDWDRPWQVWPISCIIGALSGYTIGLLISGMFHFVKIIKSKSKSKFV